jgi:hypothetical protein
MGSESPPWGFDAIRLIGNKELSLECTGDSQINYVGPTNYLRGTRSAAGQTYVEAYALGTLGSVLISARPEDTAVTVIPSDQLMKVAFTVRTRSPSSLRWYRYYGWNLGSSIFKIDATFCVGPLAVESRYLLIRPLGSVSIATRVCPENLHPDVHLFAGSDFLKTSLHFSETQRKIIGYIGQPSSFLAFSLNQAHVFRVGGFADFDYCTFGAQASADKLKLRGNARFPLFSISAFYYMKSWKHSLKLAGQTQFTGGGFDWKFETPGLFTLAFTADVKRILITIQGLLSLSGDALFKTLRYGIKVTLLGDG